MRKKKTGIFLFIVLLLGLISFGIYYYAFRADESTTLTLKEKQWIENNRNKVFDLSITNEIPVFNYNGQGLFFDFLSSMEKELTLDFNKVPTYYGSEEQSGYAFQIKKEVSDNDILIYEDSYALLTKEKIKYSDLSEIKGLVIGVTDSDLELCNTYLKGSDVTFKTFKTLPELFEEISKENSSVQAIVAPELLFLKQEIENENIHIAYLLEGFSEKYVFSLGDSKDFNTILKKYYKKWSSEQYENSFHKHFANDYFEFAKVEEKEQVDFKSKRYSYGFIENRPYDTLSKNKLYGINSNLLSAFSKLADIEISYQKFQTESDLLKSLNENKIDFMYGMNSDTKYDTDVYTTLSVTKEEIVFLGHINQTHSMNSISAFQGVPILALKGTKISQYLKDNNLTVKEYKTLSELLSHKKETTILALDSYTYEYYARTDLKNYLPIYRFMLPESYGYVIRDIHANEVFEQFLDFYISFVNEKTFVIPAFQDLLVFHSGRNFVLTVLAILVLLVALLFLSYALYRYIHTEKKQANLVRGDRIRYIDQLTSLKNRNYLNDNIEKWDNTEVYPQSVIVVDLNNIAYINDNYGHGEGDSVIKEAANILIKSQIENSEIMRTNGNEFLIYLVGYDEKQIVSYTKKLNKELKEIAHGFGAAVGYSMITDAIKTIDDAVNEATLDMRAQKEESTKD